MSKNLIQNLVFILMVIFFMPSVTLATDVKAPGKQGIEKGGTTPEIALDKSHTAVLIMDYQNDIVSMLPEKKQPLLLDRASRILKEARLSHLPIIYIAVRFREGYPEISPQNKLFSGLKESGRFREGTSGAEIHSKVTPQPGDLVVTKRRVGAFSTTDLEILLRAKNVRTLVLFGISTSGVVLSTVRWAADMDYSLFVISDACADSDEEVHRVLTEKVFPRQATVITTAEFLKTIRPNDGK
jgi:nicotinamidase-related amidase